MPLFVSNTLMRAVKLSNLLPLPSGTNNGTFNLAFLNDINTNIALTCSQTNKQKREKNTHTQGEKREAERDLSFLIMEWTHVNSLTAYRGQCCSVTVREARLHFKSMK